MQLDLMHLSRQSEPATVRLLDVGLTEHRRRILASGSAGPECCW
jgi:hypothetical protein